MVLSNLNKFIVIGFGIAMLHEAKSLQAALARRRAIAALGDGARSHEIAAGLTLIVERRRRLVSQHEMRLIKPDLPVARPVEGLHEA